MIRLAGMEKSSGRSLTGKKLAELYGIEVKQALYSKGFKGNRGWYHTLDTFPAALMDPRGYILFPAKSDYDKFIEDGQTKGLLSARVNQLSIKSGISSFPQYQLFAEEKDFPEEITAPKAVPEGARKTVVVNAYERNPEARDLCIEKWGVTCSVCDFNFEDAYGEIGNGFIHVHHLIPLSTIGEEYELDPESDLRPVCPNCHAMLHRKKTVLSIEKLKDIIKGRKS
ncbi:MAG: hypothetical protein EKK29_06100 [Hyphomicrobiales bacterium]|nr:MAG: hypothetical protein EKK29_06100 [Hyphomicrobiales bacterium]